MTAVFWRSPLRGPWLTSAFDGYATRWLLATAALFTGSGLVYLLRRGSRS